MQKEIETQIDGVSLLFKSLSFHITNQQQVNPQNWCVVVTLETDAGVNARLKDNGF